MSEEGRPRDASPASVVFGVDRGQVFGVAARINSSATSAVAAAAFFAVGSSRSKPKKNTTTGRLYVLVSSLQPSRLRKILVINWLGVYTELATGYGATRARGSRCSQPLPWYQPYMILLLSYMLCWVVCETEWSTDPISIFDSQHCCVERDFMRADGDYF